MANKFLGGIFRGIFLEIFLHNKEYLPIKYFVLMSLKTETV